MKRISKSYQYLLVLVIILFAFPFVSGFILSKRIQNNQYTLQYEDNLLSKISIPDHKTLVINSYKNDLILYLWWNNDPDTIFSNELSKMLNNKYYYKQQLTGDTLSIFYKPYLKKYIESIPPSIKVGNKNIAIASMIGKSPETLIIKGGEIQVSPILSAKPVTYIVQQGILSLGILNEYSFHFNNLIKHYPTTQVGFNYQPDWENKIISPSTIYLSRNTSLFLKDGYNVKQTEVITSVNSYINIENPNAHLQVKWQLSDSTLINCSRLQEDWFRKNFPDKIILFTTFSRHPNVFNYNIK